MLEAFLLILRDTKSIFAIVCAALSAGLFCEPAFSSKSDMQKVQVEKSAPTVARRMFIPWNPFEERPTLEPGQKALTQFYFKLSAGADDIEVLDENQKHGRWFVDVQIKSLRLKLSLPVVIWTPHGAPRKCIQHEEGHRIIAERIYEFADDIITYLANRVIVQSVRGEGGDRSSAVRDAVRRATTELNQSYRTAVLDYSKLVTEEYDKITKHGLDDISEEDAIAKAFESCEPQMSRLLEKSEPSYAPVKQVPGPMTKLRKSDTE